ncbi:Phenolpthiocerol synthesis polyketide synthase ppsA, partial [Monoraphidium neglectum]
MVSAEFLAAKRCALSPVPPGRYPPGSLSAAAAAVRLGVLPDAGAEAFDHRFFHVSPAAVADVDPQQRMALEVTYEALQDAGLSMERMRGLDIGVFAGVGLPEFPIRNGSEPGAVGSVTGTYGEPIFLVPFDFNSSNLDYEVRMAGAVLGVNRLFSSAHLDTVDPRPSPSSCFVANRVSHFFDFTGPSVAIDTACSSSLTALHLAANSLRAGDCCAAVVIGTSALLSSYVLLSSLASGAISPTGDSRPFDARANGFVRAEGAVAILLLPVGPVRPELGAALAGAALRPYGYVVGSGAGADGAKPSAVAPAPAAQQRLMRQVHARAGVDPADVCYMEAHATGTAVGDPTEALSIGTVLGRSGRPKPLPVGSLKGNLGHLESAAGLASLVKVLVMARHRVLLPTASFEGWSPKIDAARLNIRVVAEVERLATPAGAPFFMGINSFGMGGANAYAIIRGPDEGQHLEVVAGAGGAPARLAAVPSAPPPPRAPLLLLPLAAHDASLLAPYSERWAAFAAGGGDVDGGVRAHQRTAALSLRHRAALLLPAPDGAAPAAAPAPITPAPGLAAAAARGAAPRVGVVFCGQGTHWPGMGGELWTHLPAFRVGALEFAATYPGPPLLLPERDWGAASPPFAPAIAAALAAPPAGADVRLTLPATMMVGYAQWRVLCALGVRCAAAAGHSAGEMLAALAAGEIDLRRLCQLTYARAAALGALPATGGMAAVSGPRPEVERLLAEACAAAGAGPGAAAVAATNAPGELTVSGAAAAIAAFVAAAGAAGLRAQQLPGARAFHHGPSVSAVRGVFFSALAEVGWADEQGASAPAASAGPAFCPAGVPAGPGACRSAERWWQQLLRPVDFQSALAGVATARCDAALELGPRSVLRRYAAAALPGAAALALVRAPGSGAELRDAFEALARLWLGGAEIRWGELLERGPAGAGFPRLPWLRTPVAGSGGGTTVEAEAATTPASKIEALLVQAAATAAAPGAPAAAPVALNGTGRAGGAAPSVPAAAAPSAFSNGPAAASAAAPAAAAAAITLVDLPQHYEDHRIGGRPLVPATAYLSAALVAAVAAAAESGSQPAAHAAAPGAPAVV